jgi:hypothetical protein
VLVIASCDHELCSGLATRVELRVRQKFVAAEYGDQHAGGVRSPEGRLRRLQFNGSLAAYEEFSRRSPFARYFDARANAITKASVHV